MSDPWSKETNDKVRERVMSDLQQSLPPRVPPPQPDRFNDSEVLFTTLILMLGEPPIPPIIHGTEGARMKYAHDMKQYGFEVKLWMSEYGHNPHIGLFSEYMHWCRDIWALNDKEYEKRRRWHHGTKQKE